MHALYERYSHLVLGVCLHYLQDAEAAKEATRQIFIKLLNDLARFEIQTFRPWLLQVCRNYCQMALRKANPNFLPPVALHEEMDFEGSVPSGISEENLLAHLNEAMDALSPEQHTCIRLFYEQRQTYQEIVAATGYTLPQVKSYLQNGKKALKNKIIRHVKESAS